MGPDDTYLRKKKCYASESELLTSVRNDHPFHNILSRLVTRFAYFFLQFSCVIFFTLVLNLGRIGVKLGFGFRI